jgi:hypothetical protein
MRPGTGLHSNQARLKPLEERQHLAAPQLATKPNLALGRDAVQLENILGQVEADCGNLFHGWLLSSGTFMMSPSYGILRCREREPSTPSMADNAALSISRCNDPFEPR